MFFKNILAVEKSLSTYTTSPDSPDVVHVKLFPIKGIKGLPDKSKFVSLTSTKPSQISSTVCV